MDKEGGDWEGGAKNKLGLLLLLWFRIIKDLLGRLQILTAGLTLILLAGSTLLSAGEADALLSTHKDEFWADWLTDS